MNKYMIHGGRPLSGTVTISGAKNAAVAILPAAILVEGTCRIENLPNISDVNLLLEILAYMGADVRRLSPSVVEINCTHVRNHVAPADLVRRIRASSYLIGAQLGRFGHAKVAMPGGCYFGVRPIDQHIKGFEAMGAEVEQIAGFVEADAPEGLHGGHVYLDIVSVGATMNIMIAAVLADGLTVIENCAREPHIVDLANFLNAMGAEISGAGTNVIKVRGVKHLYGGTHTIIPDQIEAGTYMTAVAATGGSILVENIIPKHMDCITAKLREMGVQITEYDEAIRVERGEKPLRKTNVKTMPYPGFPTDMQPQIVTCLALASGTSIITESIYDNRYRYVAELCRMGAAIQVDGKVAVTEGVPYLQGCEVKAYDLRAGAAMVIAGLAAHGETTVEDVHFIERGYEDIVGKLQALGADIKRVSAPPDTTVNDAAG